MVHLDQITASDTKHSTGDMRIGSVFGQNCDYRKVHVPYCTCTLQVAPSCTKFSLNIKMIIQNEYINREHLTTATFN